MYTPEKWTAGIRKKDGFGSDDVAFQIFGGFFFKVKQPFMDSRVYLMVVPCHVRVNSTGFLGAHQEVGDFTVDAIIGEENQWLDSRFLLGGTWNAVCVLIF